MEAGLMPQTILGLDIGQSTIKAVLLARKGLTGGRILDARILNINDCGGIEAALKKLAEDKIFSGIPCCISLPPADIMFRQISLPFRDENRIRKTLAFELEPLIPLPIEEVTADYLMIPHDGLLVAALTKKSVQDWIEKVEGNLGEISAIDASPAALAAQITDHKKAACGIILDIGRDSTGAAFYEDGAIVHVRSLAFGGAFITEALAADMSLTKDEVEKLKIGNRYSTAGAKAFEVCRNFCSELKNTIEYMKLGGVLRNEPAHITITGGGSLFLPLQKELENCFSSPVEVLDLIRIKQLEVEENIQSRFVPQIMNTAIATAMRTFSGHKSFNFRQGEFAARNIHRNLKKQLKGAAIIAGIIFLLAVVNQILDYSYKTQRLNSIKKQIAYIFKKNFPEAGNMVDPVQQMKTRLVENKKTYGFYEGLPEATVAELLREISSLVSSSLDIVINGFNYENKIIVMQGEAKKIDDVSAVRNELLKSGYFKDVAIGQTSLTKDGDKVDFNLRIEVK
jgi:Tfp pilus assembly PilM family ATPase